MHTMTTVLKVFLIGAATLAVLIAGFFAFNSYIYSEKQAETPIERYRGTLSGEFVCLPKEEGMPRTEECAFGIKTDTGELYAVDFMLMSQTAPELVVGEHFSANGMITPKEMFSSSAWQNSSLAGVFSVTDSVEKKSYPCNGDAKMCPDGSLVGRTGPQCEFAECPPADRTNAVVTTYLGGEATALTVSAMPREVVSDSRCPSDVQCIWQGAVEVRTALATPVSHGEHVMKLGEPQLFGEYTVTLIEVSPYPKSTEEITDGAYRFTFRIERR